MKAHHILAFIGDSDIYRWPRKLFPSMKTEVSEGESKTTYISRYAEDGALLRDLPRQIQNVYNDLISLATQPKQQQQQETVFDSLTFIACAGENDISSGTAAAEMMLLMDYFEDIISSIFCPLQKSIKLSKRKLIFLGPKLEPWLEDDVDARMDYFKLSMKFSQKVQKWEKDQTLQNNGKRINNAKGDDDNNQHTQQKERLKEELHYIDCLKMFCGETSSYSVTSTTKKALPQKVYFDSTDGLHLSNKGYKIWKERIEHFLT